MKKKTVSKVACNAKMHYLNLCKADLARLYCVDFGKSEFLNMNIFNWYKALYLAHSRMILCSFKHVSYSI